MEQGTKLGKTKLFFKSWVVLQLVSQLKKKKKKKKKSRTSAIHSLIFGMGRTGQQTRKALSAKNSET